MKDILLLPVIVLILILVLLINSESERKDKVIDGLMKQIGCTYIYEDFSCGNYKSLPQK